LYTNIPKVDKILDWPEIREACSSFSRPVIIDAIREVLDSLRSRIRKDGDSFEPPERDSVAQAILGRVASLTSSNLKRVINGTGVIIHTNLGRSPLSEAVRERFLETAFSYSNLEYDLKEGIRGSRNSHVEPFLCRLTGAEAALVVNNNAAAVLLALSAIASGKEVIVSRGELVEIGGSFRIPDIMGLSGAILKEVGTTNRTHPADYRKAMGPDTALLLKVHRSNFAVVGFTAEPSIEELAELGRESGIAVMADLGSGNLFDLTSVGIQGEPTVSDYVRAGVDIITFSGDKLLGGPQAGIIVGKKAFLEPLRKHPFMRALRMDKLTLAALEETLRLHLDERSAKKHIPVVRMLTEGMDVLTARGQRLKRLLRKEIGDSATTKLVDGYSQAGGGAMPLIDLPTKLLAVSLAGVPANKLEERLRNNTVPILGIIRNDQFQLDMRTLFDRDLPEIVTALLTVVS
jgi:L-seryl-tRNA(Ser) seleniumtransferase